MARKTLLNWTIEGCSTIGTGNLVLTGAIDVGQTAFRDSLSAGSIWYSIVDGANRETGLGTFDGNRTIVRNTVHATLINGHYTDENPAPLSLTGTATIAGTFNSQAYQNIVDELEALGNRLNATESDILALELTTPTPSQKAALDAAINPSGTNPFTTDVELQAVALDLVVHEGDLTGAHSALAISVNVDEFNNNLSPVDTDVQKALNTIDDLILGETTPPLAYEIVVNTSAFSKHLTNADTDVQKALNTIDQFVFGEGETTTIHNELLSIQGGEVGNHYHITLDDVNKLDGIESGANLSVPQNADEVPVDTTNFIQNLSATDTDVQIALETLDRLVAGGGTSIHNDLNGVQGGATDDYYHLILADVNKLQALDPNATPDQAAADVPVVATGFSKNLSASDTDVQTALNTIDGFDFNTPIPDHDDLNGLSGGATGNYYHLTSAEVSKLALIEPLAKDDQLAIDVPLDTTNFSSHLTVSDVNVQLAMETIDQFVFGDGEVTTVHNDLLNIQGGSVGNYYHLTSAEVSKLALIEPLAKDDQLAVQVPTDASVFSKNLSTADVDVQKALITLDQLDVTGGGGTNVHNDLLNIQGGAAGDYFHLTLSNVNKLAGIEPLAKDDQLAVQVPADASVFNNNLSTADTDVQKALITLDQLDITGGGGGEPDQDAFEVPTNFSLFNNNLSANDTDVQKALDTLDDLIVGDVTPDHDDLNGLSGGATGNYYHLTSAEVSKLALIEPEAKDDQLAIEVPASTTNFNNNLSASDTDVQKALDTIDNLDLSGGGGGGSSIGENLIMNSDFAIWQKGTVWDQVGDYFCDRWRTSNNNDTAERDEVKASSGAPFSSRWMLKYYRAGSSTLLRTGIEGGIGATAGKVVTLSFWIKSDSSLSVNSLKLVQTFDGSTNVGVTLAPLVTTTDWTKYEASVTMPFIGAKNFGPDANLSVEFSLSSSSTLVYIAEMKLEVGSEATAYQVPDPAVELSKCQRYYVNAPSDDAWYVGRGYSSGDVNTVHISHPSTMRHNTPSITVDTVVGNADLIIQPVHPTEHAWQLEITALAAVSEVVINGSYNADAEYY